MWYNGAGGDFLTHLLVVDDEVSILELIKNSLGKVEFWAAFIPQLLVVEFLEDNLMIPRNKEVGTVFHQCTAQ